MSDMFRDVTSLHTYNEFDGVRSYDHSQPANSPFRGNGQLKHNHSHLSYGNVHYT